MIARAILLALVMLALAGRAAAQSTIEDTLTAQTFDRALCMQAAPPEPDAPPSGMAAPPVTWSDFEVVGRLAESPEIVRALFEPTMLHHRALTDAARQDIRRIATAFGYHVVGIGTRTIAGKVLAVVHIAPFPLVRRIDVDIEVPALWRVVLGEGERILDNVADDEIRRRLRVRAGSYVPWTPLERACDLYDEERRLEEFLRDEGYFDAVVKIRTSWDDDKTGLKIRVDVRPGQAYEVGVVTVIGDEAQEISHQEIRGAFDHSWLCLISCVGKARFRREQHQRDVETVVEWYRKRVGYPSVRVRSDFDPLTSFNPRTKKVDFTITIDTRRKIAVTFEGHSDAIKEEELDAQLTFDEAQSADDVEVGESARAITTFLQGRGYFDARVTWTRERFEHFDRIVFRIDQGALRRVRQVSFAGNRALSEDTLRGAVGTSEVRLLTTLAGRSTAATSARLAADVDALVDTYRRAGYREARVRVTAATDPAALGDAAMTAALALADRGDGLYVRFTIDEGQPTLITRVELTIDKVETLATEDHRQLCTRALAELAGFFKEPQLAKQAAPDRCIALAANLKFRETDALETREQLKDRLFSMGRPRAKVGYEIVPLGTRRVGIRYALENVQPLSVGKVVVRGNFRTSDRVILGQLGLREGTLLSKDALADGARKLRNTGLFNAVNIAMPDLETTSEGEVNAVVEVTERYDRLVGLDFELGASTYNGLFGTLRPQLKNLGGRGISLDTAATAGLDIGDLGDGTFTYKQLSAEATLRVPQWLLFDKVAAETTIFHRQQDTERFGPITTDGATLTLTHSQSRPRTETESARVWTLGVFYDFRRRERLVDVLRPPGADDDEMQVPISTRLSSVGMTMEWERRTDRNGSLTPLNPERGFRAELRGAFYEPWLLGQDKFVKLSGAVSKYHLVGDSLLLRADLRYDHGIPLGGAVLLPEVERYFAGGDSTVRGYEDDRLATEVIRVGVPPFDNVSQLRILPAGGNIRAMGSLDAQLRIYKILATAVFVDAGMITNTWSTVDLEDVRPAVGIAVFRLVTPFGIGALERAIPLNPNLGDNPRGRWHFSFAARAQF